MYFLYKYSFWVPGMFGGFKNKLIGVVFYVVLGIRVVYKTVYILRHMLSRVS